MGKGDRELRPQIEQLYALPPAAFTAARQELAARLRREGRRQDAAAVKALRRPTPAAWAVSRLLRLEPQRFQELLAAGSQARLAQRRVLAGKAAPSAAAAGELRESLRTAKRLVEELRQRGLELLAGGGRPPTAATADRLTADLQALAYTAGAERALAAGWLDHDLEAPGFEVLAGLQAAAGAGSAAAAARRAATEPRKPGAAASQAQEPAVVPVAQRPPSGAAAGRRAPAEAQAGRTRAVAAGSGAGRRREEQQRARVAAAAAAVQRAKDEAAQGRAAATAAERAAAAATRVAAAAERRAEQARREAQRERQRAESAEERLRRARERHAAARATPG